MASTDNAHSTTFLLVRHGATAHTAERRFSGSTGVDPALSDVGRHQAGLLAAALRDSGTGIDAVVSSPIRRARQTATVLGTALGLPVRTEDDLREVDFGAWEGLPVADVEGRWPAEVAAWRASPSATPPGGESVGQVADRVRYVREGLADEFAGGTLLVVSHLYPVRVSVLDAIRAPHEAVHRLVVDPTGVSEIRVGPGASALVRYNDASHLRRARTSGR